jgi:hypothetical protein
VPGRYAGLMKQNPLDRERARFDAQMTDCLASAIQFFLLDERRIKKNDRWFSVKEVADELKLRRHLLVPYIRALRKLVDGGKLEGLDGCMRHV